MLGVIISHYVVGYYGNRYQPFYDTYHGMIEDVFHTAQMSRGCFTWSQISLGKMRGRWTAERGRVTQKVEKFASNLSGFSHVGLKFDTQQEKPYYHNSHHLALRDGSILFLGVSPLANSDG